MQVTFTLSGEQFAANDYSGVMVGLPLAVQLDAGALLYGPDDSAGWWVRTYPAIPRLQPVSLARAAFCGRIAELAHWSEAGETLHQALLDCGAPLRVDLFDPEQPSGQGLTPFGLQEGDWLLGVAEVRGLVAFNRSDLLWQPVQGSIVDIQRLALDPARPDFGSLHWLHGLPQQPFAPDQVFVTIKW